MINNEEKICPMIKEPCLGKKCSEFVPRHTYKGEYGYGLQDLFIDLWCWINKKEYHNLSYVGTICAHCKQNIRAADKWDKDEFKEDWTVKNKK